MVTEMNEWVSVSEAAELAKRSTRQIYRWIEARKLATYKDSLGRYFVKAKDVLRVEADQKRGRPQGTPSLKGKL